MKEWTPGTEWRLDPMETHALFYALISQIKLGQLDPTLHIVSVWMTTLKIPRVRLAPVPYDFDFWKKVCETELNRLADAVGDEPAVCNMQNCAVYDHRMGLRYFLEDKLGIQDKFADTGIV